MRRNRYKGYDCDAVVIGSGIAGLSAGAYLARRGVNVVVCEHHSRPGGYFSSFQHKGYTFDGGIQACENLGVLIPMLRQLGVLDRIHLAKSKVGVATPDILVPLDSITDMEEYFRALADRFPSQKAGLMQVSEDLQRLSFALDAMVGLPLPMYHPLRETCKAVPEWIRKNRFGLKNAGYFARMMQLPVEEYLARHLSDPNLLRIVHQVYPTGTPTSFALGYTRISVDYYYPDGGMQAISDVLAQYIRENGGQVMVNTLVEEILLEEGRAGGVRVQGGETIRSPFVVSAGDARRAMLRMLPAGAVPESYRKRLENTPIGESLFNLFLGVDIPPDELPLKGCQHLMPYSPTYRGVSYHDILHSEDYFQHAPQTVSVPNLYDHSMAPEGKSAIICVILAVQSYADNWGTRNGKRTVAYRKLKEKVSGEVIETLEKIIPGISGKVEVQLAATPYTQERYSLNSGGAMAGWTYNPREMFHNAAWNYLALGHFTPVKNLLQTGHWAFFPGGAPAGMIGGKLVAEIINARLKYGI